MGNGSVHGKGVSNPPLRERGDPLQPGRDAVGRGQPPATKFNLRPSSKAMGDLKADLNAAIGVTKGYLATERTDGFLSQTRTVETVNDLNKQRDVPATLRGLVADTEGQRVDSLLEKDVLQLVLLKELERFLPDVPDLVRLKEAELTLLEACPDKGQKNGPDAWHNLTVGNLLQVHRVFEGKWGPPHPPRLPDPPEFLKDLWLRRKLRG